MTQKYSNIAPKMMLFCFKNALFWVFRPPKSSILGGQVNRLKQVHFLDPSSKPTFSEWPKMRNRDI